MKVVAMYLPQFHQVKENDEWWGEGFTDWIAAKKAQKLYPQHYQPHIPLNNNYYNLLEKETMQWQADLMHQYGVDGMCMYHYWFANGRQILEKPAENLLKWTDIDMPFCFSWANETWARSWSKIKKANAWAESFENHMQLDGNAILLQQEYGSVADWKQHFQYLLPFFKDKRYICIDGKPVFMLYKTNPIDCLAEMLQYWRMWIKDEGFQDLYIIGGECNNEDRSIVDAVLYKAPGQAIGNYELYTPKVRTIDYCKVWDYIISEPEVKNTFYAGFVGYDDTPRRGNKGVVVDNASPDYFAKYLALLMAKNAAQGNDITFINAWNEWGEGMHLEPDERNKYSFLEQIHRAKETFGNIQTERFMGNEYCKVLQKRCDKHEMYLNDLDFWMGLREKGENVGDYIYELGFRSVAIYGYGIMGRHLRNELQNSKVECKYIIDIQKQNIDIDGLDIYAPDEELPKVDVVVVASYFFMDEIDIKCYCPVVGLDQLLYKTYNA